MKHPDSHTALIIDDEELARESIKILIKTQSNWQIIGEAEDGNEALKKVNELKPDLIFLDIDMPKVSGLDMIKSLVHKPFIVFTTAYDNYALKAFEENAVDYLLKPYTDQRFLKALDRVELKILESNSHTKLGFIQSLIDQKKVKDGDRIAISLNDRIVLVEREDINWVQASGNYLEIHTSSSKYLHYATMGSIERILAEPEFIRIHRSYIVKAEQISELKKHQNGEYFIILNDGTELKMSRSNRGKIDKYLERLKP